jgi:hypothetical protein
VLYEFIKVNCNSDAGMLVVSSFFDADDSGEARSKHPGDNTYYLEELAKDDKRIACDLGNNHVVFVDGFYSEAHPRDNGFGIFIGPHPQDEVPIPSHQWVSDRNPIVIIRNLYRELEVTACQRKEPSVERECSITTLPYEKASQQQ